MGIQKKRNHENFPCGRPAITLLPFELQTHLKKVFQLLISSVEWSEVLRQYLSRSARAIQGD